MIDGRNEEWATGYDCDMGRNGDNESRGNLKDTPGNEVEVV